MGNHFPIMLQLEGKKCVVIGGGKVAERKITALLAAGAAVTVISPEITEIIQERISEGCLVWLKRQYQAGDLENIKFGFVAVGKKEVSLKCRQEADKTNTLLNIADMPEFCDFILPASLRRGELLLTVCTDGNSPMLAKKIRQDLSQVYGKPYAVVVAALGKIREKAAGEIETQKARQEIFQYLVFQGPVDEALKLPMKEIESFLMKAYDKISRKKGNT
ncbi:MAG: bifunctional precorrin-2 dehydrogenase/sirohydrochlorin ferrochelatase [Tindallia sp. MSAO_Bac2]|nr:MAG: bifunctional precorrin-2 dehydrogenase/sirohydrochlorin ferrochelatase [Tindallia sp. MSAO_Bac2]